MAVITITINESSDQVVSGIPKTVILDTNVPATVFYTLDGSVPTVSSTIAVGPIKLPTIQPSVTLKAFATDGVTTSAIITELYSGSIVSDRNARDRIYGLSPEGVPLGQAPDPYPFGDYAPTQPVIYGNTAGIVVDAPGVSGIPDGYDGTATGTPSNYTDLPISSYELEFSDSNSIGERGRGIGTLPAQVTIIIPPPAPEQSKVNSKLFNPKAMVIFQDGRDPPEDPEVSLLNRQFFNLENPETARDGILYGTTAIEGSVPHGSFLRAHFNARENTYTFYYRDSLTNRWIISKEPYMSKDPMAGALYNVVFRKQDGIAKIFKWIPFSRRVLDAG
jgi:hypothetical protein